MTLICGFGEFLQIFKIILKAHSAAGSRSDNISFLSKEMKYYDKELPNSFTYMAKLST